jgi:hypothetical protein
MSIRLYPLTRAANAAGRRARRLIAHGESSRVAISSEERPVDAGRMFLTPEDGELVRMEGRLARILRYGQVGWMSCGDTAGSMEHACRYRLSRRQRSTLSMTYRYSEIDDRATNDERD